MAQSVTWSWIESVVRTLVLFLLAQVTFWICGIDLGVGLGINILLTVASLLVSYYVRRGFVHMRWG